MERYIQLHSCCTDPTQAAARLVIVLESWIQKNGTEDNNFQFCQFGPTRPVKVDHLQSWSRIFRSDQIYIPFHLMYQRNVRHVGLKGILIRAWATCGDGGLQRCWYKVLEVSDLSKLPGIFLLISPSENKTILARARQITFFFSMDTFISILSLSLFLPLGSMSLLFHSNEHKEKKKCVNKNMVARCFLASPVRR